MESTDCNALPKFRHYEKNHQICPHLEQLCIQLLCWSPHTAIRESDYRIYTMARRRAKTSTSNSDFTRTGRSLCYVICLSVYLQLDLKVLVMPNANCLSRYEDGACIGILDHKSSYDCKTTIEGGARMCQCVNLKGKFLSHLLIEEIGFCFYDHDDVR